MSPIEPNHEADWNTQVAEAVERGTRRAGRILEQLQADIPDPARRHQTLTTQATQALAAVDARSIDLYESHDWDGYIDPSLAWQEGAAELDTDPSIGPEERERLLDKELRLVESHNERLASDSDSFRADALTLVEEVAAYPWSVSYPYPGDAELPTTRTEAVVRLNSLVNHIGDQPFTVQLPETTIRSGESQPETMSWQQARQALAPVRTSEWWQTVTGPALSDAYATATAFNHSQPEAAELVDLIGYETRERYGVNLGSPDPGRNAEAISMMSAVGVSPERLEIWKQIGEAEATIESLKDQLVELHERLDATTDWPTELRAAERRAATTRNRGHQSLSPSNAQATWEQPPWETVSGPDRRQGREAESHRLAKAPSPLHKGVGI